MNLAPDRLFLAGFSRLLTYWPPPAQNSSEPAHPYKNLDPRQHLARRYLAWRYLSGEGIEIGALHLPLKVPARAKVKFVDRSGLEELRKHYPELDGFPLVEPDYVENGEELPSIAPESIDFIIANHFIEHCENPIGTIEHHLTKLRTKGIIFMAVPLRDATFDRTRPLTTLEHLEADYRNGPEASRRDHYEEWVRHVVKPPEEKIDSEVARLMQENYSIHYHVWNASTFHHFLQHLASGVKLPMKVLSVVCWKYNPFEAVYIIQKL